MSFSLYAVSALLFVVPILSLSRAYCLKVVRHLVTTCNYITGYSPLSRSLGQLLELAQPPRAKRWSPANPPRKHSYYTSSPLYVSNFPASYLTLVRGVP